MSTRTVGLIGFVACAGITGVWGLVTPGRLYTFFLAAAVVCYIHFRLGNVPRQDPDPESLREIYNVGYSHGLRHGAARTRAEGVEGGDDATRTHARRTMSRLPKVG